jgi:hypothetical protein
MAVIMTSEFEIAPPPSTVEHLRQQARTLLPLLVPAGIVEELQ